MKLEDIVNENKIIDLPTLKEDEELVKQIQVQLSILRLYPASEDDLDGLYGNMTATGLTQFCTAFHLDNMRTGKFGKSFAEKLLSAKELPQSKTLSEADYQRAADMLGVELAAIKAVVEVEASSSGFFSDGRPKILFERHWFWSLTPKPVSRTRPDLSSPDPGGYIGGPAEWERLNDAIQFDRIAALKSASWGLGQVMGFNHEIAGYKDVEEFVRAMHESEGKQLDAMMNFIRKNDLDLALRSHDWITFARGYNGKAGVPVYSNKIADAYRRHLS
jgi:hypothetical protein